MKLLKFHIPDELSFLFTSFDDEDKWWLGINQTMKVGNFAAWRMNVFYVGCQLDEFWMQKCVVDNGSMMCVQMYACMWMCKYTCVLEYVNVWKCVLGERKYKPINLNDNSC